MEFEHLDKNAADAMRSVCQSFDALQSVLAKRKQEVLSRIETICQEKQRVFNDQLQLIHAEKDKVERDCEGRK